MRTPGEEADLVLLRRIETPAESAIVRHLLEDAGVRFVLRKPKSEGFFDVKSWVPDSADTLAPVEIWVRREEREDAEAVLTAPEGPETEVE